MATGSAQGEGERDELMEICSQIGALIIGQRHDRMNQAVGVLQKRTTAMLLRERLDDWHSQFDTHFKALERVIGEDLKLDDRDLVNDLKTRVSEAGFDNLREFVDRSVLPVVAYHGLLMFLNNEAGVVLPEELRGEVADRMKGIRKVLGGACAAMVLQESMGI